MHSRTIRTSGWLLLMLLLGSTSVVHASGSSQTTQWVQSTSVVVSGDGNAAINQTLVMPQNTTSVTVPLLSNQLDDVLALNQTHGAASYVVENSNITIYTLGNTLIYLSYDTEALTSKQGSVWTVDYTWISNSTLELPSQSTVLYLSGTPLSISAQGGSPVLLLSAGTWSISYGLPVVATQTQTSSSTNPGSSTSGVSASSSGTSTVTGVLSSASTSTTVPPASGLSTNDLLLAGIAIIAVAAVGVVWRMRSSKHAGSEPLRPDDLEMLRFIRDRGGKVVEAEIRERFSVPRTTAWRQTKRLEQLGYIRVRKLGSQNQLELIKSDF